MRIPVTLVAGYLGAGKTSLINRLLAGTHGRRIAVLVNDFGAVNIDASLVAAHDDQTISLTNGCVCCSIADDLGAALDAQANRAEPAEHVVIEASGVADPARLARLAGGWPGLTLDAIVAVADAETIRERVRDKFVGSLVARQLTVADIVILNKIDLASPESLANARTWIAAQAPSATMAETLFGAIEPELLLGPPSVVVEKSTRLHPGAKTEGHARFSAGVWRPCEPVNVTALRTALEALPDAIHRAKGLLPDQNGDVLLVQRVGRRVSIELANPGAALFGIALIGIGSDKELKEAMAQLDAALTSGRHG